MNWIMFVLTICVIVAAVNFFSLGRVLRSMALNVVCYIAVFTFVVVTFFNAFRSANRESAA
jgi:glycopeptide antibiotics resistance protein